jgi:hypothetical protein
MKKIKSIKEQIEELTYSQSKLIDLGFKKIRVTRIVYEYELETRNRSNIYTKEEIISKLEKIKKDELNRIILEEEEEDENIYYYNQF